MTPVRRGSAILLCLGLSVMAVMIGYALLRVVAHQNQTGRSQQLIALAQVAARSGAAHAMEMILRDYNTASLAVAQGSGSVTVSPVPTHLDGMFRAPFVSWREPESPDSKGSDFGFEDAPAANLVYNTLFYSGPESPSIHTWSSAVDAQSGFILYDGRGRWIEMNYHNISRPSPTTLLPGPSAPTVANVPQPVTPTSFIDTAAATPERSQGLFLDQNLARLQTGTPAEQRQAARFRLRYAVGVEDLNGHLLINPRADMNVDWTDANNDYRVVPAWVQQGAYMLDSSIGNWQARGSSNFPDRALGLRLNHVFQGRGQSDSADRKPAAPRQGLPATFPMMFRQAQTATKPNPWYAAHGYSQTTPAKMPGTNTDVGFMPVGGRLFGWDNTADATYPAIQALAAGGQVLTPIGAAAAATKDNVNPLRPYVHALTGPQQSWFNLLFAVTGVKPAITSYTNDDRDGYWYPQDGRWHSSSLGWARWWHRITTNYTLYGRPVQAAAATPPLNRMWHQGECNTAWQVNLLTATSQTLSSMLLNYMPPQTRVVHYEKERWFRRTAIQVDPITGAKSDVYDATPTADFETNNNAIDTLKTWANTATLPRSATPTQTAWDTNPWAIDACTDLLGSGFTEFPAPASTDSAGNVVKPDFYQIPPAGFPTRPPESRYFEQCYPGPAARVDPQTLPPEHADGKLMGDPTSFLATYGYGFDDLGAQINVDTALGLTTVPLMGGTTGQVTTRGWCATTFNPIIFFGNVTTGDYVTYGPNATWPEPGNKFRVERYPSASLTQATSKNSYFWDLITAMVSSISYARATWDQYPTRDWPELSHFNPQLDSGSYRGWQSIAMRDPTLCRTIEQIDALFLRNLGENFDAPGTPAASNPIVIAERTSMGFHSFWVSPNPVSNTIRSLVTGDLIKVVPQAAPGPPVMISSAERGKVMERVLNDYRMSFFGASPQYAAGIDAGGNYDHTHGFRPLDFDGDGKVVCSAYPRRGVAGGASAQEVAYCTDRWMLVDVAHPKPGRGPRPTNWWSATGCFYIGKSHYYRIFVRGELYDNMLKKPVAQQDLETVFCVDPDAPLFPAADRISPDQRVLFQQWRYNPMSNELPGLR